MEILNKEIVFKGNWTDTVRAGWENNQKKGYWEYIARKNDRKGVVIIPRYKKNDQKYYLLIKQFRVPFNDYVIEFPAGLKDDNETIEQCALRELKEETGAEGKIIQTTPFLSTSSGITNEKICIVYVEINKIKEQSLDSSESISLLKIKKEDVKKFLKESEAVVDSKVWIFFEKIL